MSRGILVVWWGGLIGALVATLVVLKQVTLVLNALRGILSLSERTREAAEGIATNVAVIPRLGEALPPAIELREAAAAIALGAASVERKLTMVSAGLSSAGGAR